MNTRPTLLEGDPGAHLRRLALPLAWGMFALTSFALADTFFISRLGTLPLAALGFCIPVVMFFMGVIFGLSVGTSSAVSRLYGGGDFEKVRRLSTDSISLGVAIVLVACAAGFVSFDHIFRMMGAKAELMPLIRSYMSIWYVGLPFLGALMIGNACVRAMGDTRFVSHVMTGLALSNIILDPCFIFGLGPFPEMGMKGAAITHVVTNYAVCIVSFYHLIYVKKLLKTDYIFHDGLLDAWKKILHVAVPSVISNQIAPISAAIITWMAASYGKEAVAALGVASRIDSISTIVFYSTGAGVSIFTGQNYGAGNLGRIQEAVKTGSRYSIIWGLMVAAVLWVFAHQIPLLFDKNELVAGFTTQYLHWVPISYGAMGTMIISNAALNAMGKPLPATILILLKAIIIYIPLAYVLQPELGFMGILVALMVTNFVVGIISYFWNRKVAS